MRAANAYTPPDLEGFPAFLVQKKVITRGQAAHLGDLARRWGSDSYRSILGAHIMGEFELSALLAEYLSLPHVDLVIRAPDAACLRAGDRQSYIELQAFPFAHESGLTLIACAYPSDALLAFARERYGDRFELHLSSTGDILGCLQRAFATDLSHLARERLYEISPENSAKKTLSLPQKIAFTALPLMVAASLYFSLHRSFLVIFLALNAYYLFTLGFRLLLTVVGSGAIPETEVSDSEVAALDEATLPTYTVLVAMYKEAAILPILAQHLRQLNYPRSKLTLKIVLEEDDVETIAVAKQLRLENFFEFIVVPASLPKTKPKALNYALPFVQSEFVTIYDAEDRPEPDQLKKAYLVFRRVPAVVCVQARLNYFNRDENLLTRMFTMEYSQWFDFFLVGLYKLNIPIPLGGTSNHFRTHTLRELGGWDPYNVTEDADLGLRLEKMGHRVAIVNSTTWEEANTRVGNWVRQRSRWLKGHMQTFLVHTRHPLRLFREIGPVGFFGFVFFIGGPCLVALLNPLLLAFVLVTVFWPPARESGIFTGPAAELALFNLYAGNVLFIFMGALALEKRKFWRLMPWAIFLPAYWLLQSVAAYKAVWQVIFKPHFWEKTTHGLSGHMKKDRESALRALTPGGASAYGRLVRTLSFFRSKS